MKNNDNYFLLFASCVMTKGVKRSIISDLQRGNIYFLPNDFHDVLTDLKSKPFNTVLNEFDPDSKLVLASYIDDLIKNELGFWTKNPEEFPDLDTTWDAPALITNAILDFHNNSTYSLIDSTNQITELGCKHFQYRFYSEVKEETLFELIGSLDKIDRVVSYEIHLPFCSFLTELFLHSLVKRHAKVKTLLVHSAPFNKVSQVTSEFVRGRMGNIYFTKTKIDSCGHCGVIDKISATSLTNILSYSEAKNHNSCLNRKIGIDVDGNIKNCPSMKNSFGSITNKSLSEIVQTSEFKMYSAITKSEVAVCKSCEFRDVCFDCRAYTEDNDLYGKPKKCNYNPNLMKWKN